MRGVLKDVVIIKGKPYDVYDEIVVILKPETCKNKTVFTDMVKTAERVAFDNIGYKRVQNINIKLIIGICASFLILFIGILFFR